MLSLNKRKECERQLFFAHVTLKHFGADEAFLLCQCASRRRIQQSVEVCAFGWRIKNRWVLSCYNINYLQSLSYYVEARHTEWACIIGLPWNRGVVRNHGRLVKVLLAALVWASKPISVSTEKLHMSDSVND